MFDNRPKLRKSLNSLSWLALHTLVFWAAWQAIHGNIMAGRFLGFYIWVIASLAAAVCIMTIIAVHGAGYVPEDSRQSSVPPWLKLITESVLILMLVLYGWTVLAVVRLLTIIMAGVAHVYPKL